MDWFLYDNGLRHERVKYVAIHSYQLILILTTYLFIINSVTSANFAHF